jgi:hypothetical protein
MPITNKTYPCSDVRQLIDINGDAINFNAKFTLTSTNGEEFDMLIVDQTMLDNQKDLQYKKVSEGTISGKIELDKNVYQNYFIILRSDKQIDINVELDFERLPDRMPTREQFNPQAQPQPPPPPPPKKSRLWMKILIGVAVISAIVLIYFLFFHKKGESEVEEVVAIKETKSPSPPPVVVKTKKDGEKKLPTFDKSPIGRSPPTPPYSEAPSLGPSPPKLQSAKRAPAAKKKAPETLLSRLKTFPLK